MTRRALPGRLPGLVTHATLAATALLVAGCIAPTEPLPHDTARGAPNDGELFVYDVTTTSDGTLYGRTAKRWNRTERGFELAGGAADKLASDTPADDAVLLDPKSGEVLGAWKGSGDARIDAVWDAARGVITMKGAGLDRAISVPPGTRDNDELLESLRFAGLQPGRSVRGAVFNRGLAAWIPVQIDALEARDVETPAGRFRAIDHRIGFGTQYHHAFIEEAAPHRLVRYDNATGATLALRSHRKSKSDTAPIETAPVAVPGPTPKASLILSTLLAQWPLMIGLPMLIAFRLRKALKLPWSVWGLGALGFVLSQVVHLPLNWALGLMGAPRALGIASPIVVATALGLTAGLCEEVTRYAVLRKLANRGESGARVGLVAGAGHGGIEALIFGVLSAATAVSMWTVPYLPPSWVGMPPEARDAFAKQVVLYWSTAWELPIYAGIERVSAILFHIGMSVLIARGIQRGRALAYVALAVSLHAAFDGAVVFAVPRVGILAVEGATLAVSTVIGLLVVRALRRPAPSQVGE